jgi:hypothetical protein
MTALPLSTPPSSVLSPSLSGIDSGTVLGTEGGELSTLVSRELETWLGELATKSEERLWLRIPPWLEEGAAKLNHWTTDHGVGEGEVPASIHVSCLSM